MQATHRRPPSRRLALAALAVLALAMPPRVARADPAFPSTPIGTMAAEFLAAFNDPDESGLVRFFERYLTAEDFARRPLAERVRRIRHLAAEQGRLTVETVHVESPEKLVFRATSAAGERLDIDIVARPGTPPRLAGIGFEVGEHGGDGPAPAAGGPPIGAAALRDSIDRVVDAGLADGSFAGVVHVVDGGRIVHSRAVGMADRRRAVPNRIDTRFNIGSIGKLFTVTALAQLMQRGQVKLDDPVSRHLPDYPKAVADRITVRQLVDHTSGLGDFFGPAYDAMDKSRLQNLADFVPLFLDQPLEFEPGARTRYSNAGYTLLGLIVERVSGQSYPDYMREHVFAPAGMENTGSSTVDPPVPGMATGYTRRAAGAGSADTALQPNTSSLPGRSSSAGGGYSTVADLVRFTEALATGRLLDAAHAQWVARGPEPVAGAAPPRGRITGALGVAGGAPGLNAVLDMDLERGRVLVVMANLDPPSAERMARRISPWVRRLAP